MKYKILIDGKDYNYKTLYWAIEKYMNTQETHLKRLLELIINDQNDYEYKTLVSNYAPSPVKPHFKELI